MPSPAPPSPFHLVASPTMFSSASGDDKEAAAACPYSPASSSSSSSSAYSPYSPAARHRRSSSALQQQEMLTTSSSMAGSPLNLQESLLEFSQLQDRIKKEQEQLLDSHLSMDIQAFGNNGNNGGGFAGQSLLAVEAPMSMSSSVSSSSATTTKTTTTSSFYSVTTAEAGGGSRMMKDQPQLMFDDAFETSSSFSSYNRQGTFVSAAAPNAARSSLTIVPVGQRSQTSVADKSSSSSFRQPAAVSRHQLPPLPSYTQVRQRGSPVAAPTVAPVFAAVGGDNAASFSIKLEPGTTTTMTAADLDESATLSSFVNNNGGSGNNNGNSNGNNAILRQFLQDTTFQAKFNLKPFDLGGGLSGFLTATAAGQDEKRPKLEAAETAAASSSGLLEVKIEPVLDLAVQQVQKDIDTTCEMLSIAKGRKTMDYIVCS